MKKTIALLDQLLPLLLLLLCIVAYFVPMSNTIYAIVALVIAFYFFPFRFIWMLCTERKELSKMLLVCNSLIYYLFSMYLGSTLLLIYAPEIPSFNTAIVLLGVLFLLGFFFFMFVAKRAKYMAFPCLLFGLSAMLLLSA